MKVSATILAAGESSRMENGNKLLLPINEIPMITHVFNTVLIAGLDPVVVVTGCDNELVTQAIPCLLYTSPSPRDATLSRMPSSA